MNSTHLENIDPHLALEIENKLRDCIGKAIEQFGDLETAQHIISVVNELRRRDDYINGQLLIFPYDGDSEAEDQIIYVLRRSACFNLSKVQLAYYPEHNSSIFCDSVDVPKADACAIINSLEI